MSTHRSHSRVIPRWHTPRQRLIAAATAALVALALIALTLTLIHDSDTDTPLASDPSAGEFALDLDGDGTIDDTYTGKDPLTGDTIEVTADDLIADRNTVRDTLGVDLNPTTPNNTDPSGSNNQTPPNRVSQALLTPATPAWWKVTVSVAANLHLNNLPAPPDALWYAVTTSRAQATSSAFDTPTVYNAIHVAFPTVDDTYAYLEAIADTDLSGNMPYMRDTTLTFAPAHIDLTREGYDPNTPTPALRPVIGTWTIDYGLAATNITSAAATPTAATAFTTYMTNVGYGPGVTWSGIAPTPTSPWTGTLTGFNKATIDHRAAINALASTETVECDDLACYQIKPGLTDIPKAAAFYLTNPRTTLGQTPALEQLPLDDGTLGGYSIDWGYVHGMVTNNYQSSGQAPFPLQRARLYPSGRQIITLDPYDNSSIGADG